MFTKKLIQQFIHSGCQHDHSTSRFERKIIDQILDSALSLEGNTVDLKEVDTEPDTYWNELLEWFSEENESSGYMNEVLEQGTCKDVFELFQAGQSLHHAAVKDALVEALENFEQQKEEEEEEEEELDHTLKAIEELEVLTKVKDLPTMFCRRFFYIISLGNLMILLKPNNVSELWIDDTSWVKSEWNREEDPSVLQAIYPLVKKALVVMTPDELGNNKITELWARLNKFTK